MNGDDDAGDGSPVSAPRRPTPSAAISAGAAVPDIETLDGDGSEMFAVNRSREAEKPEPTPYDPIAEMFEISRRD